MAAKMRGLPLGRDGGGAALPVCKVGDLDSANDGSG